MKKRIVFSILFCLGCMLWSNVGNASLIAGWDFQTTTTGGTAVAAIPSTLNMYIANVGSGTMFLDGSHGADLWTTTNNANTTELNAFTGSSLNVAAGMTSVTTTPASLALVAGGTTFTANGKSAVFLFSMLGLTDLSVSLATQRSGTGFTTQDWYYSTDGTAYTYITTLNPPSLYSVLTLPTVTALDNQANAYLKVTVNGATGVAGNNRLDNIQLNANTTSVPEPSTYILLGIALGVVGYARKRMNKQA